MPRGDRTGSWGGGPMTGRGLGYCAGFPDPGFMRGPGMGMGRGFGRGYSYGRGRRRGYSCGGGGGLGRGGGFGRGRGRGRFYDPNFEPYYGPEQNHTYPKVEPPSPQEEGYLKNVVADLEEQVKSVKARLKALATGNKSE